jgi:hypothetical protein
MLEFHDRAGAIIHADPTVLSRPSQKTNGYSSGTTPSSRWSTGQRG